MWRLFCTGHQLPEPSPQCKNIHMVRAGTTLFNHLWRAAKDGWQLNSYSPIVIWNEWFMTPQHFICGVGMETGRTWWKWSSALFNKRLYYSFLSDGWTCSRINKVMPASCTALWAILACDRALKRFFTIHDPVSLSRGLKCSNTNGVITAFNQIVGDIIIRSLIHNCTARPGCCFLVFFFTGNKFISMTLQQQLWGKKNKKNKNKKHKSVRHATGRGARFCHGAQHGMSWKMLFGLNTVSVLTLIDVPVCLPPLLQTEITHTSGYYRLGGVRQKHPFLQLPRAPFLTSPFPLFRGSEKAMTENGS